MKLGPTYKKEAILNLIAGNNLQQALLQVNDMLLSKKDKLADKAIILFREYSDIKVKLFTGILSDTAARIILNEFTSRLLQLVELAFSNCNSSYYCSIEIKVDYWFYNNTFDFE